MSEPTTHALWGGRFRQGPDPRFWALNASLAVDQRLGRYDARASRAWAQALGRAGVLTPSEVEALTQGLARIEAEFAQGTFPFAESDEDIHTAIERRLKELVGEPALKLHTGRSRNDQVVTAFRLWMREAIDVLAHDVRDLMQALLTRAEADQNVLVPGYTHLQQAQPILLAHLWMAHFWAFARDRERLADTRARVNVLPLGSGALAGTTLPIDRAALAHALGFAAPTPNSWDAVADRDFAAEFLFVAALIGVHLSRLAEQIILFNTREFGFITLDDRFSTGSSLMPQKKNPDGFELARGKAGTLIGLLTGLLATLKGLPSAYDKDLQEDKDAVFRAFDTLHRLLPVVADSLRTLHVHADRTAQALDPATLATDLADYLVERGVPFREAHRLVGQLVQRAEALGVGLHELPLHELQAVHPAFQADVYERALDPRAVLARRDVLGGTAPRRLREQLTQARLLLEEPGPFGPEPQPEP
ncbi:MAG: argininosuccinate lyase [Chloroflexi bacterium]|nr:argininosuccinate lyase [Chloroflexota bacterium]